MFRFALDAGYELENCARSMPECYKRRERCLGTCGGENLALRHDFATDASKRELSTDALGERGMEQARANCTTKTHIAHVTLFEGGGALAAWTNRLRVRSGMLAINPIQVRQRAALAARQRGNGASTCAPRPAPRSRVRSAPPFRKPACLLYTSPSPRA